MAKHQTHALVRINPHHTVLTPDFEGEISLGIFSPRVGHLVSDVFKAKVVTNESGRVVSLSQSRGAFADLDLWARTVWDLHIFCRVTRIGNIAAEEDLDSVTADAAARAAAQASNLTNASANDKPSFSDKVRPRHRRPFAAATLPLPLAEWGERALSFQTQKMVLLRIKKNGDESLWSRMPIELTSNSKKVTGQSRKSCADQVNPTSVDSVCIVAVEYAVAQTSLKDTLKRNEWFEVIPCSALPLTKRPQLPKSTAHFHFTLQKGRVHKGKKKAQHNVEAVVTLRNGKGEVLENCMGTAHGDCSESVFRSTVIYHSNSPVWEEGVHIQFPMEMISQIHFHIELFHCSTKSLGHPFAFTSKHIVEHDNSLFLDTKQLELFEQEFPRHRNPTGYLTKDWTGVLLPDSHVTVTLKALSPPIRFVDAFSQLPVKGCHATMSLDLYQVQYQSLCKQWVPSTLVFMNVPPTRVLLVVVKADFLLLFTVDPSLWDAAIRPGATVDTSKLMNTKPLVTVFLEDCTLVNPLSGNQERHKLGIFTWSASYILELPNADALAECAQAIKRAQIPILKRLSKEKSQQASRPLVRFETVPQRVSRETPKGSQVGGGLPAAGGPALAQSRPPTVTNPHSLDPREMEQLQLKYQEMKRKLETTRERKEHLTLSITKIADKLDGVTL